MTDNADIFAMLSVEFDAAVDRISREMFAERLAEYDWAPQVAGTWTLVFEPRARASMKKSVQNHLDLACQAARITREQIKAIAGFSEDEPTVL